MKNVLLLLTFLFVSNIIDSQIVPSYCTSDSITTNKYIDDADQLTLQKIYSKNLIYKDSVRIPTSHSDTILRALLAVHNAYLLPARDTVVTMLNIHALEWYTLNSLYVEADSNMNWMKNLARSTFPSGHNSLDSILLYYDFSFYSHMHFYRTTDIADFNTTKNLNIKKLASLVDSLPQILHAAPNGYFLNRENNISSRIDSNYVELIYSHGWGDCPAGCIYRRYWKFKVYYNCDVEYVGSYGDKLPNVFGVKERKLLKISVFPNPFVNSLNIIGIKNKFKYSIFNSAGQLLIHDKSFNSKIEGLEVLNKGVYFLTIFYNKSKMNFVIMK